MRSLHLGVLIVATVCSACAGDDDDDSPTGTRRYCSAPPDVCDIEEASCIEALSDLAACERGDHSAPLPDVKLITSAEFAEQLRGAAAEGGLSRTPWDSVLPKLGLLPEGQTIVDAEIELASTSVAAFYHLKNKDITIITDSEAEDAEDRTYVLLHELTHYHQDRAGDIERVADRMGDSLDNHVSANALVEGEAVVNSTRAMVRIMGRAAQELNWTRFFNSMDEKLFSEVSEAAAPLSAASQFLPYSVGGRYVAGIWNDYGRERVDVLFDESPEVFCDWLADPRLKRGVTLQKALDCGPPVAPAGFVLYELDSFGAAGAFALFAATPNAPTSLASSLRNDAFAIYVDEAAVDTPGEARAIAVWRLRFDSEDTAEEAFDYLERPGLELQQAGRELIIRVSSADSITELRGSALDGCPKLQDLEPVHTHSENSNAALRRLLRGAISGVGTAGSIVRH